MKIFMEKKINIFLFSAILLIAVFLRFYQISDLPPSLNWDEVSIGYNAYSILETVRDEWGNFLPLSFRAFGDYKLPLYVYLDVPFVAIFGLNEIMVRLPSVLSGIGIVVLIFFVLKELTKSTSLALWGMFIGVILPWLVIFSRIALEANLALFLTVASFYLLLLSQRKKGLLPISAILLGLSTFTYNSSRVLILPLLLLAAIFLGKGLRKREVIISLVILLCFITVAFIQALTIDSGARYKWTTILDEGAMTKINQLRGLSTLPPLLNKMVNNKVTYFVTEASKNYSSHFSPNFLFWKGGSNFQFSVLGIGQIYPILIPLILLGILQMAQQRKNWQLFILGWLLIAPIPGAITRDAPHALRAIFMIPSLIISGVMGVEWLRTKIPLKIYYFLSAIFVLVLFYNSYLFWQNYSENYRRNYSESWQYGYKQAVEFIKAHQDEYSKIIFTKKYGEPHIFTLFYLKYDPYKYQTNDNLVRYQRSDWFWVDGFDKYEFINDWEIKDKVSGVKNALLISSPGNYPTGSQVLDTIKFLNSNTAFEVVAVK